MRFFFFCCLALAFTRCSVPSTSLSKPNVIILFTDDQRFNTIHALGNEAIHTPNLDRLVSMGMSYTRAHIPGGNSGAVCAPSRAMLLTGRPFYHLPKGFTTPWSVKDRKGETDFLTFPEVFRAAGYQTFFTGKWHNDAPKLHAGFSHAEHVYMGGMHFLKDGGHEKPWVQAHDPSGIYPASAKIQMDTFSSELYTNAALRFLHTQKSDEKPFLMMVSYTSPHDPRQAPKSYQDLYPIENIQLPPNYMSKHPFDIGHTNERDENLLPMPRDSQAVKGEIAGYYAMISEVDAQIGRILDQLEESDQLDHTIIVFAGDNGLGVGQHSLLGKQNLYEHSIRVPLILAGPGIPKGKQSNAMSMLIDVFPTIAKLAAVDAPESIEGQNLQSTFESDDALRDHIFLSFTNKYRGIRTVDNWKYIHYFVHGQVHEQLFNLNDDPWEINNLIADSASYLSVDKFAKQKEKLKTLLLQELIANKDEYLQPKLKVIYENVQSPAPIQLTKPFPEVDVRYTLDRTTPNSQSPLFESAMRFDSSVVIHAQSFWKDQAIGAMLSSEVPLIDGIKSINWSTEPPTRYAARGKYSLIDGLMGGEQFRDGKWLGFEGEDLTVDITFEGSNSPEQVFISCLQHQNDWIFFPKAVRFSISNDGQNYQVVEEQVIAPKQDEGNIERKKVYWKNKDQLSFRYLKVHIQGQGQCPPWHKGAGGKAWLFLDEVGF